MIVSMKNGKDRHRYMIEFTTELRYFNEALMSIQSDLSELLCTFGQPSYIALSEVSATYSPSYLLIVFCVHHGSDTSAQTSAAQRREP